MRQFVKNVIQWVRKFLRDKFHQENELFPYYLTILISFGLFVVSLNVFVEITDDLKEDELTLYDDYFTHQIQSFHHPSLIPVFQFITHMGDRFAYLIFIIAIGLFFFLKHGKWTFTIQTVLVLMLSSLSNLVLKRVINRDRPSLEHLVAVSTLSFPSGHAMSAMAFYGFLIYLCIRLSMPLWLKMILSFALGLLILLIGISRIYLGVHFPSDVLAGFIGGLIWVTFCAILFNIIDIYRKKA
ncbi:MAG: phosphatase PAP2 family protein [Anditalea sp.]